MYHDQCKKKLYMIWQPDRSVHALAMLFKFEDLEPRSL